MTTSPFVFGGIGAIPLKRYDGTVKAWAIVDACDFMEIARFKWHMTDTGYAVRFYGGRPPRRKRDRMHRRLLGLPERDARQCDHINRNRLDNRRSNLRIVSGDHENKQNVPGRGGTSQYRGVSYNKARGKWIAQAKCGSRRLGQRFDTEEEAAACALAWRREHMPHAVD